MERQEAIQQIRRDWKRLYPADKRKTGIICPLCNSGSGPKGTGITADINHGKPDSLHCWACGFSGDVLDLIQQDRRLNFNEALQYAADQLGIVIDRVPSRTNGRTYPTPRPATEPEQPAAEQEAIADYSNYYMARAAELQNSQEGRSYLQARGISEATAKRFLLGYDPAWISPAAVRKMEADGNPWRPSATARIIIPVSENHYIARAIDPAVIKYNKPNETGGGHASSFNLAALHNEKPVFVVEGAFDALSVVEAGENAIALNSTARARAFIKEAAEKGITAPAIILCMDNDGPGKEALSVLKAGLDEMGVLYMQADISGNYKDPNEALVNERETFIKRVKDAERIMQEEYNKANRSVISDFLDKVQGDTYKPYETGLPFFDNLLGGGVIRQTLLLLLAAPGAGKTTLCQQIAEEMARREKPVIYLNFEMSREQMIAKAISARTHRKKTGGKYSFMEVMQGYKWTPEQREEILREAAEYEQEVLRFLKYNPSGIGSDLEALREYLDSLGQEAKATGTEAPVIIVDYLHLITSSQRMDVQELIKQTVFLLKDYAIKNNTFVIAISATNRASNSQGRISLESARDSSAIEYTADTVLSLNYFEVDRGNVDPSDPLSMGALQQKDWRQMIIRVNKSRFTMPGRIAQVYFYPAGNTFYDPTSWMPADPERVPFPRETKETGATRKKH